MNRPARVPTAQAAYTAPNGHAHPRKSETVLAEVLRVVKDRGARCVRLDFRKIASRIVVECAEGHVWRTDVESIVRGSWCHLCGRACIAAAIRKRFGVLDLDDADEVALYAETQGLAFVDGDPPRRGRSDFFRCGDGHLWEMSRAVPTGAWCPACGALGTALGVERVVR